MAVAHQDYVPAAGAHWLLPLYDPLIALLTREKRWRGIILDSLELHNGDTLVDVGSGTGTLAVMAKQKAPGATVIGIDPDPDAIARAQKKGERKGASIQYLQGFGNDVAKLVGIGRATKVVSSVAFHHMEPEMQAQTLSAVHETLTPGGMLRIADFVDGHFGAAAESKFTERMKTAGFKNVRTLARFRVAFANAALFAAEKAR